MVWIEADVDVNIRDIWSGMGGGERREFLAQIESDLLEIKRIIYEFKYLHLHDNKTTLEVLEELEGRLQ